MGTLPVIDRGDTNLGSVAASKNEAARNDGCGSRNTAVLRDNLAKAAPREARFLRTAV